MQSQLRSSALDAANSLQFWLLTHGPRFWNTVQRVGPAERVVNRVLINSGVMKSDPRPYRLSTLADYPSIESLTDRTYNSRQLAAPPQPNGRSAPSPSPSDVAELFRRPGERVDGKLVEETKLCPKSTVLFAYVAQWFTDGFLRSRRAEPGAKDYPELDPRRYRDISRTESTQEIDMTPLYGLNREQTRALRTLERGRLRSQSIGGEEFPEFLFDASGEVKPEFECLPPPVGIDNKRVTPEMKASFFAMGSDAGNSQIGYAMLNVLFLREHNRIAGELERNHPDWDDERLFQTTRNTVVVALMKLVIEEYINHIAPYHFQFKLQPAGFSKQPWMRPNWIAVEFNLLYRWHSLMPSTLTVHGEPRALEETINDPRLLTRQGLGPLFDEASRQRAGKVCLFNTADFFHGLTTLPSIVQSRAVPLARYNDYREACKMSRLQSLDELSSDSRVRAELARLYGNDIDDVEFYPGIFAEDLRPNSVLPGLLGTMVGVHAFSQLLTNPLLAPKIWDHPDTFGPEGRRIIEETNSLAAIVKRNLPKDAPEPEVRMTRADWTRV
ncbi:MAG: heme peroxidase [Solirubrobacterales bacterium]|nr:heme peroxidase [Solirubrobacterales bacterium]